MQVLKLTWHWLKVFFSQVILPSITTTTTTTTRARITTMANLRFNLKKMIGRIFAPHYLRVDLLLSFQCYSVYQRFWLVQYYSVYQRLWLFQYCSMYQGQVWLTTAPGALKILLISIKGEKWPKNNHLTTFTKVKSKSPKLKHSVNLLISE